MASPPELLSSFGNRIRAARGHRGWTQDALGERASLNPKYIGELERGQRNPSLTVVVALALALDVEVGELVGDAVTVQAREALERELAERAARLDTEELRRLVQLARWSDAAPGTRGKGD